MTQKDLFVLTADADALAVMRTVLSKPAALGIRPITFTVDRHTGRDNGMIQSGPELARLHKAGHMRLLLIWDHHGSGWEQRYPPDQAAEKIQRRLDGVTWKDNSSAIVVVPELEEWIWHNLASITSHFQISKSQLDVWIEEFSTERKQSPEILKSQEPKRLFEHIVITKIRRTISPRDFQQIASKASINDWKKSTSFKAVVDTLVQWFPEK